MPGTLFHVGATAMCPHGGQVAAMASMPRVFLGGLAATTMSDTYTVAGCTFAIPPAPKPQPCVKVQWLVPSLRIKINGQPAILKVSGGLCQSAEQIPQGPPNVVMTQIRVSGM